MSDDLEPIHEEENHGPVKSFLDHLEDLRWVLLKASIVLAIAWSACFYWSPALLRILKLPLQWSGIDDPNFLRTFSPMDPFTVSFQIALWGGAIISAPFIVYFLGSFILPALTKKERKLVSPVLFFGSGLFLIGAAFCFFYVLPPTLKISREFSQWLSVGVEFWTVDSYVGFVTKFVLGMGLGFELPLVIMTLVKIGILDYTKLVSARRYVIVINVIVAAIITPTSDVFSLLIVAIPMILLYEICVWLTWFMERKPA
jgi:sec-independent protein translocase protein TatC